MIHWFFTEDVFNLLMSNDKADIEAQIAAVEELGRVTGQTFENGAKEALNYLESIELVAEAMARSRENMKSFTDSLLTDEQLAGNLASSLGVNLATNVDELARLFYTLSGDIEGLTDQDLELLNANKALLESTEEYQIEVDGLNDTLDDVTGRISTLEGVLKSLDDVIEKLREGSRTAEQNLQMFYDAMSEAQSLTDTEEYEKFTEAIQKAVNYSGVLLDAKNFSTERDMTFAQLVAANQFEALEVQTMEEIDYLKQIEINTRTQIDVLVAAMDSLGTNINSSLLAAMSAFNAKLPKELPATGFKVDPSVQYAYSTILGREAEEEGAAYWEAQVASGNISPTNLTSAIGVAAIPELYATLLGRAPEPEGLAYWTEQITSGNIQAEQLDDIIRQSDEYKSLHGYSTGGYTGDGGKYDVAGIVHKGEYVVNSQTTKDLGLNNSVGVFNEILSALNTIKTLSIKQTATQEKQLNTQRALLGEQIGA